MKKILLICLMLLFIHCHYQPGGKNQTIYIKGSDTMLPLVRIWAAKYMQTHRHTTVYVTGGGTATGVKALLEKKTDICMASRPLNPEEISAFAQKYQRIGMVYMVARDGLSVYVHNNNPVDGLSRFQLKQIFTGELNNWKEVGGEDAEILRITRNRSSGTRNYFRMNVLQGERYSDDAIACTTNQQVIDTIMQHENAIGYAGFWNSMGVKTLAIDMVYPEDEYLLNDNYPLMRYLYFITIDKPEKDLKRFINWVLSEKGQKEAQKVGYIPLIRN